MSQLGDDELGSILEWVHDPDDRNSFSLVCKQWKRMEGLTRSSIRVFEPDSLSGFLPRFPNLVTFECSKPITDDDLKFMAKTCPNIKVLNLNLKCTPYDEFIPVRDDVGDDGLCALANGCRKLSKVLLRRRKNVGNVGVVLLIKLAQNLANLDLAWCNKITDQALEAIGAANSIASLNLEGCSLITDAGLASLATGASSRSLKKLVLAECDQITDYGVSLLRRMCYLEELNMAECGPKVTDVGCVAIATIQTLKKLNLSWLINVSDPTLVALAENCRNMKQVNLTGCELITGAGIRAFANHDVKKGGPSPISNMTLAAVLEKAKELDVPKEILDRNIKRASEKGQEAYIEKIYEVYGYGGASMVVEMSTDKINRSVAKIREVVKDYGGKMADSGSVMFKFRCVWVVNVKVTDVDKDQLLVIALDAGAEDVIEPPVYEDETEEDRLESQYKIVSSSDNYTAILSKLREEGIKFEPDNGSELLPLTAIEVDDEAMDLNKELMSKLLELDDVDAVYTDQL